MKIFFSRLAMLALLLCGAGGVSAENVTFEVSSWDDVNKKVVIKTDTRDCIVLEGKNAEWQGLGTMGQETWYVVKGRAQRKVLVIFGTVHLVLTDGCEMRSSHVKLEYRNGAKLHVHGVPNAKAPGKLSVWHYLFQDSYTNAAGIGGGGGEGSDMGSLYVHSGVVIANNVDYDGYGAGVGGGKGSGIHPEAEVVVYSGLLDARGSYYGAGIGGGDKANQGGPVIIYGGSVEARGYHYGAGIGGGDGKNSNYGNGGVVKIYGGNVTAQGYHIDIDDYYTKYDGSGIGGGRNGRGGDVHIYGGTVKAYGGRDNAGIGGGGGCWGGICEITGGVVKARGGKSGSRTSPAIGGGYSGNGGNVKITGGQVMVAKIGEGRGTSALIGGGGGHSDGTLDIGPGLKVNWSKDSKFYYDITSADGKTLETDASKRGEKCLNPDYAFAEISLCDHQGTGATYKQLDDTQHSVVCKACAFEGKENHKFTDGKCVCGKEEKKAPETWTITIHKTTDGKTYTKEEEKVVKGQEYVLPVPQPKEGLIFMGYLLETSADGIEMKDSEWGSLRDGGEVVKPNNDLTYYARYRYDYTTEWTWNDECTAASVKVSNAILNDSQTLNATISEMADERVEPTETSLGEYHYNAVATLNRGTGVTYQFADQETLSYYDIPRYEMTLDASASNNTEVLEQYEDLPCDVTIGNLTLKKDNKIHPLCLPFSLSDLTGTPLAGATIYQWKSGTLDSSTKKYTAAFETATTVSAGNPCFYLFGSGTDIEDPKFENVVIEDVWGGAIQEQYGELIGSYDLGDISDANKGMALVVDDGQLDFSEMTTGFGNFFVIPQERAENGTLAINTLRLEFGSTIIEKRIAEDWKGEGTEKSPYLISNRYDLNLMASSFNGPEAAKFSGKYFLQTADVEFDKTVENNYTAVRSFTGHYDGAGYTIGGLNIHVTGSWHASLFGELESSATVKNVIIQNSTFKGPSAAAVAGGVYHGSHIENCHVLKDVTVEATETDAGGILGAINSESALVTGCTSQAAVKGFSGVGGVVGIVTSGTVANSIYLGSSVSGSANTNAVAGYLKSGVLENCYYTSPTLKDDLAKLMPDKREDNTDFLTQLAARDKFLMKTNGLTEEQIGYDLTLSGRTIEAIQAADGTWKSKALSVCLPYDIDIAKLDNADNISVYRLHEVDLVNKVFQFTNDFPILKAGEPYIIVINKGSMPLTGKNVTVVPTPKEPQAVNIADGSKQIGWWAGTFKRIENDQIFKDNIYIAQKDKTFQYPPKGYTNAFTYPFVAYFSALEPLDFIIAQPKYIHTENGDEDGDVTDFPADEFDSDVDYGDETGITPVIQTIDADGTERYYDLQGRQLSGKPNKGVYIYKGKKVIK